MIQRALPSSARPFRYLPKNISGRHHKAMAPIRVIRPSRFQPFPLRCTTPRPYDNATSAIRRKKGPGEVTMHAPAAEGVHNTRRAHRGERDSPDNRSPTAADGQRPSCDYRDGRKLIQQENTPPNCRPFAQNRLARWVQERSWNEIKAC